MVCEPKYVSEIDYESSKGGKVISFVEDMLCAPESSFITKPGDPIRLLDWQKQFIYGVYQPFIDHVYCEIPKRNGKNLAVCTMIIYDLLSAEQNELFIGVSHSYTQAKRNLLDPLKNMIRSSLNVRDLFQVWEESIVCLRTNAKFIIMPKDPRSAQGGAYSKVFLDELMTFDSQNANLAYQVLANSQGTIPNSRFMITTNSGADGRQDKVNEQHNLAIQTVTTGSPRNRFVLIYGAAQDADYTLPDTWESCNPAYGINIFESDFQKALDETSEGEFKRLRLGVWCSFDGAWEAAALLKDLYEDKQICNDDPVVLGFDGAETRDCTVLVAVRVSDLHVQPLHCWRKPSGLDGFWQVDRNEVMDSIRQAYERFNVAWTVFDPNYWLDDFMVFANEHDNVSSFSQGKPLVEAILRFEQIVQDKGLSHNNDPVWLEHFRNCRQANNKHIYKPSPNDVRKIDYAVATVMAVWRATELRAEVIEEPKLSMFIVDDKDGNSCMWSSDVGWHRTGVSV